MALGRSGAHPNRGRGNGGTVYRPLRSRGPRKGQGQQRQGPGGGGRGPNPITEPWTPKQLHHTVTADTNLTYRPAERALGAERQASVQRTKDLGNWWSEYLKLVSENQGADQAAYAQANTQTQGLINQSSALDSANTAKLNEEAARSAAVRGETPSSAPTERANAAQAQRNFLTAAQGATTAAQGAHQYAYLGEQKRIGAGQSIAARRHQQGEAQKIEGDRKALAKERGEFAVKDRAEREEAQRDYLIKRGAFGLNKKEFQSNRQLSRQDAAQKAREFAAEQKQQGVENRQNQEALDQSGKGGLTPDERYQIKREKENAWVTANTLYKGAKTPPHSTREWAGFAILVAKEEGIDQTAAVEATEKLRKQLEPHSKMGSIKSAIRGW
jgi:hypothetical protein